LTAVGTTGGVVTSGAHLVGCGMNRYVPFNLPLQVKDANGKWTDATDQDRLYFNDN
jgi:hypothetical protein